MARQPMGRRAVPLLVTLLLGCASAMVGEVAAEESRLLNGATPSHQKTGEAPFLIASVPEESATPLSRPAEMAPPAPLPEGPFDAKPPEEGLAPSVTIVPELAPAIADPLTAVPAPEKPSEAQPSEAEHAPAKSAVAESPIVPVMADKSASAQPTGGVRPSPSAPASFPTPVAPTWRGSAPHSGWSGWWHQQHLYAIHQRIYWQHCAACHGVLPPPAIHDLVLRSMVRWGVPGMNGYPPAATSPWTWPRNGGRGGQRGNW
ncbi:MAG: hypothetical protein H7837_11535 [Magnetococcus sp. MYC-9]